MTTSQVKTPVTILFLRLIAKSPSNRLDSFQAPEGGVEDQPDQTDHQHGGDHEVVTLPRVARVDDQVAQTRIDCNHFCCNDYQPRNAERDAQAYDDFWQGCRKDNVGQHTGRTETEIAACQAEYRGHIGDAIDTGHNDREKRSQEDERSRRVVAHTEKDDGDRNPGDRADGTKNLQHGIHYPVSRWIPTQRQP